MTPSISVSVWSGEPPRTYSPLDISDEVVTPGTSVRLPKMSVSPPLDGSILIIWGERLIALIVKFESRFP